jgi:phospholipase/lecithinase/hemolysin/uncharacterized protein YhjY with autotransporter beta-barrel domain
MGGFRPHCPVPAALRRPPSPRRSALILALLLWATQSAWAQGTGFTGITDFGDSYADTGSAPGGLLRLLGFSCPSNLPGLTTCRFSGGTNFVDSLQAIYGLPQATNYAFGGAQTGDTNVVPVPGLPGFAQEVNTFVSGGGRFGARDLIALSIGGNDEFEVPPSATLPLIHDMAQISAANAVSGVRQLIAHGARNIAWLSPGNGRYFPISGAFAPAEASEWAHTYFHRLQTLLAPDARAGTRIFLFDFETLQKHLVADPGTYGFASAGSCQATLGASACFAAPYDVQNSYFFWDTIHPTSAGFALIARYMANQIDAPLTVAPQGHVALATASAFSNDILGRLDLERAAPQDGEGWSLYASMGYAGGESGAQTFASSYDYSAAGGLVGLEYRDSASFRAGLVFGYSNPQVDLAVQNGHYDIDAYQLGGDASVTDRHWFGDSLLAYGRQSFAITRDGIIDTVRGSTHADTLTLAARGGYLTDAGRLQIGPIAGLTFAHARIASYTERGDSLLTNSVAEQSPETLAGEAGIQIRAPFAANETGYSPFIDLTVVRDVIGAGYTVVTTQATTPLIPVLTPVESRGRTYGKIAGGASAEILPSLRVGLSGTASFGRSDGDDFAFNGTITLGL